jgi:hypothetical protein
VTANSARKRTPPEQPTSCLGESIDSISYNHLNTRRKQALIQDLPDPLGTLEWRS